MPRTPITAPTTASALPNVDRAMIRDNAFPADDEKTLQKRRHTVWDGLIMTAERSTAAKLLEEIARRRP